MPARGRDPDLSAPLWTAVLLGAVAIASLLTVTVPEEAGPIVVLLALHAAWAVGRLVARLGVPPILGHLVAGVLLGPEVGRTLARAVDGWLFPEGLLGGASDHASPWLADAAIALAMLWVGRRISLVESLQDLRATAAMIGAHVLGALALTLGLVWVALGAAEVAGARELGVVSVALVGTSGLVTGAVVHGAGARGPLTRLVMRLAVFGELAGLVAVLVWAHGLGEVALLEAVVGLATLQSLLVTLAVGALFGLLLLGGARTFESSRGAWEIGVVLVAAYAASRLGLSVPLVALLVGLFTASWFPDEHNDTVDLLAGPAFAVVFATSSARLPLFALAPAIDDAVVLVAVRATAIFGAVILAARAAGAPPALVRWGWTGLVASALPVAGLLTWLPDRAAASLSSQLIDQAWAVAALDGLLAPIALSIALRAVGEHRRAPAAEERPPPPSDAWFDPAELPEGPLRDHLAELITDLEAVVRELGRGPFDAYLDLARDHLDALRREHRRLHRRLAALPADADLGAEVRKLSVDISDRWRSHVLDHTARAQRQEWSPMALVETLDRLALSTVAEVEVPLADPDTHGATALATLAAWFHGGTTTRRVPLREVYRYHLSGRTPERLVPVAARLINLKLDLAAHSRELFQRILDEYVAASRAGPQDGLLQRVADDIGADFDAAHKEVVEGLEEALHRVRAALRHATRDIAQDLMLVGTFDLPAPARTLARAQPHRDRGVDTLTRALTEARAAVRGRFSALALEIELSALGVELETALHEHGSTLARLVKGKGVRQVDRVVEALTTVREDARGALADDGTGQGLAERLREATEALSHVATDAIATAEELREQLSTADVIAPLLTALLRACHGLTEHYVIPVGEIVSGGWALPHRLETTELPFREVVLTFIETTVTQELRGLTQRYALDVSRLIEGLEDLDRAVGFNVELAAAELLLDPSTTLGEDRRRAVREVLSAGLERTRGHAETLQRSCASWFGDVEARVRGAVLGDLDRLRVDLADGDLSRVDAARRVTRAARQRARSEARPAQRLRLRQALQRHLGDDRVEEARRWLGIRGPRGRFEDITPRHFAPPQPTARIPVVYRRLFSDHALDAGELLGGRQAHADEVRDALRGHHASTLRSVAVIGPSGAGQSAVVRAALRALKMRGVHRLELTSPATVEQIDAWVDHATHAHVYVLAGLPYLYTLRPGGFAPLRRFTEHVLADRGRNAWIVESDDTSWRFAADLAPLTEAFPVEVRVDPMDREALELAVLARHRMSGFSLSFAGLDPDASEREQARFRRAWFREFHENAGGVARDAMALWLAAVVDVDVERERVVVGAVPRIPTSALRHLSPLTAATLRATVREGWMDTATYQRLFDTDAVTAAARLARLAHWGLLLADGDHYHLPHHLQRALLRVLRERRWE